MRFSFSRTINKTFNDDRNSSFGCSSTMCISTTAADHVTIPATADYCRGKATRIKYRSKSPRMHSTRTQAVYVWFMMESNITNRWNDPWFTFGQRLSVSPNDTCGSTDPSTPPGEISVRVKHAFTMARHVSTNTALVTPVEELRLPRF